MDMTKVLGGWNALPPVMARIFATRPQRRSRQCEVTGLSARAGTYCDASPRGFYLKRLREALLARHFLLQVQLASITQMRLRYGYASGRRRMKPPAYCRRPFYTAVLICANSAGLSPYDEAYNYCLLFGRTLFDRAFAADRSKMRLALGTLTLLEIVLGIDNIIFNTLVVAKLPPRRKRGNHARRLGLAAAMVMRGAAGVNRTGSLG